MSNDSDFFVFDVDFVSLDSLDLAGSAEQSKNFLQVSWYLKYRYSVFRNRILSAPGIRIRKRHTGTRSAQMRKMFEKLKLVPVAV
jgi:hypothetical protein